MRLISGLTTVSTFVLLSHSASLTTACEGVAIGTPCGDMIPDECGGYYCDSAGECVQMNEESGVPCGGFSQQCRFGVCNGAGSCVINYEPDGNPCSNPGNGGPCAKDECRSGVCVTVTLADGSDCNAGGDTRCRKTDTCSDGFCVDGEQLPVGTNCATSACRIGTCSDSGFCEEKLAPKGTFCGDFGPCKFGLCDAAGSCIEQNHSDGVSCNNGCFTDFCRGGMCVKGEQLAAGTTCASTSCTTSYCSATGECEETPDEEGTVCGKKGECFGRYCNGSGECVRIEEESGTPCGIGATTCKEQNKCDGRGVCTTGGSLNEGQACDCAGGQCKCTNGSCLNF